LIFSIKMRGARSRTQRGFLVILLVAAMVTIMFLASYAIDRSFLNYRRVQAQQAADAAALAAGWWLSSQMVNGASATTILALDSASAQQVAVTYAGYNGYVISPAATTFTYDANIFKLHVQVSRTEPTFFASFFGQSAALVGASATVDFQPTSPLAWDPSWYGRVGGPLLLSADGPQEGYNGGDLLDSVDTTEDGTVPNNSYNKLGEVYEFTVPANYASVNSNQKNPNNILFEIYDPGILGINDELDHPASPGETWDFSLWKGFPRSPGSIEITHQDYMYGEFADIATQNMWVTPDATWDYNAKTDLQSAGSGGVNYYIEVSSDSSSENDVPGSGTGHFKNGYQLRAGPEHSELMSTTVTNASGGTSTLVNPNALDITGFPLLSPYYGQPNDVIWENEYGYDPGFSGINSSGLIGTGGYISGMSATTKSKNLDSNGNAIHNGVTMSMVEDPSVTCVGLAAENYVTIYFGYAPPNQQSGQATTITFRGWDQDTGAESIYYTCSTILNGSGKPVQFPGQIGGNSEWSNDASNTVSVGSGTIYPYTGGNWTAWYVTGPDDNTTWTWTGNSGSHARVWLISTNNATNSSGIW